MSKEDIDLIWQKINCEACYAENINYCKEKCECKCREFIALENILNRIEELEEKNSELKIKNNSRIVVKYAEVRLEEILKDNYISKAKVEEMLKN